VELTIEKLVYGGDGLARAQSGERAKTVFVPFVLPGEQVEATAIEERPGFARARLDRVLRPSALRSEPPCLYFTQCGGCQYQHVDYAAQLNFKSEILRETIRRTAKIDLSVPVETHSSPPLHYRNRTRFHLRHRPEFAIGYFREGSHELLPVRACPISSLLINRALDGFWKLGATCEIPTDIAQVEMFSDAVDERLLIELYFNSPSDDRSALKDFARNLASAMPEVFGVVAFAQRSPGSAGRADQEELLFGEKQLKYRVGDRNYSVSAGSFFQTNRFLVPKLAELVVGTHQGRLALDLYSGVGLFAAPLARGFERVIAVESYPASVQDLRANVSASVKVSAQSTEAYLTSATTLKPDFIVVDPPRSGLGARVCAQLNRLPAGAMTYLSCDPATLARDSAQLLTGGWRISEVHLIDLFPQTFHIETSVMLRR
jgi:23S rRNA (uracil1939-C5)-methyltransferase